MSAKEPYPDGSAVTTEAIARLASGDDREWRRFCKTQGRLIQAAGHKVGLSQEEKDDLVQNTCVVCYHSIDRLRDPRRLGAWVYRIAYRQALEIVRKRPPTISTELEEGRSILDRIPSGEAGEDALLELSETSSRILRVVGEVGDRCRRLLETLYLEPDVPAYEDVSQRLGMPIGSIGPTRARCLDRVRRRLKQVSGVFRPDTTQQRSSSLDPTE